MNYFFKSMMLMLVAAFMIVGCSKPSVPEPPLTTMKLHELYPGDIKKADYIEIRSGSTGEIKSYADKKQVQAWINEVRDMEFVPDPNQEGRTGYLYAVSLFENKELTFKFTSSSIDMHYYINNEELKGKIQELFESESK